VTPSRPRRRWQDSGFEDLVQYNDGFCTGLVGAPEQIAERIVAHKRLGIGLFLLGFLHYLEAQRPEPVTTAAHA
jgi:alkanesulfonate monooxygenase SsuD/methylene tetrahydromethanopterin reductase-like flavin-dependent oxidoreductase (luciferase family)